MFKSWKSRAAVFAVAATMAVPVFTASSAGAAKGGTDRPYKASASASGPGTLNTFTATGSGSDAHLGMTSVLDVVTGFPSETITETAANGDTLISQNPVVLGPGTANCPPIPGAIIQNAAVAIQYTITGGTGRFTGATGSYVSQYCTAELPGPVVQESWTATGTITY